MKQMVLAALVSILLASCSQKPVERPIQISDHIVLTQGIRKGEIQYLEERKKEARLSRADEFQLNPIGALFTKRDTLNVYGEKVYRKVIFKNSLGSEIFLLRVYHNDSLFQECDESGVKEAVVPSGSGLGGSSFSKKAAVDENAVECLLKRQFDTIQVEAYDPDGMVSKYRIVR